MTILQSVLKHLKDLLHRLYSMKSTIVTEYLYDGIKKNPAAIAQGKIKATG